MAPQGDLVVANANGATFRSDMNDQLMALGTLSSGSSAPSTTYAYQLWADTANNLLKMRNGANNAWIEIGDITAANLSLAKLASPTFTGTVTTPELSCSGTSRLKLPVGTTAQRPGSPSTGDTRYNSTIAAAETYTGSSWDQLGGAPTGAVFPVAHSTVPSGYLECNGAAVSRSTYANLFGVLSTSYGAGDGSSTFNLPDLRGEFIRGWDNSRGIDSGRAIATAQSDQNKAHTHGVTDPGHVHNIKTTDTSSNDGYVEEQGDSHNKNVNTDSATTGISINSSGGTEVRVRNIAMMYDIKF